MTNIFKIQPEWCREPLPLKIIKHSEWSIEQGYAAKWDRVLGFDPICIYDRIWEQINPFQRVLSIPVAQMFPSIEGYCACGCGVELGGARYRWANDMCRSFAWDIRSIICNTHQIPGKYIDRYYGNDCIKCGESGYHDLDHIVGVKHGGGGCWLSNYQYLCKKCHRTKTNKDFGWNKLPSQLTLFND